MVPIQAGVAAVADLPTAAENVIHNVAVALAVLYMVRALFFDARCTVTVIEFHCRS